MKKIKLTDTELELLHTFGGYLTKQEILEQFQKNYRFREYVDPEQFDTEGLYWLAINTIKERDCIAHRLIAKLNQMSDRNWEKEYEQK